MTMDDDTYVRQPIDWSEWRWKGRPEPTCTCAMWQAHNQYWLETEGRPGLGWKCGIHGVFHINELGEPEPYQVPESAPRKSQGTLKREAWERVQQKRLFEDVA